MLLLKLFPTPLVILAVTLIGRRWKAREAGIVAGLPVGTGPISVFPVMERGPEIVADDAPSPLPLWRAK